MPGRSMSGFRTGPLGLGHIVLNVETSETIQQLLPFYRDLLGFRLTDYYSHPFEAFFLHVNPRHHSLAMIRTGKNAVHHIMMEVFSLDDMGQGYDIAQRDGRVATTMGRHTSDFITSFYTFTPSGFMVEYGWGARSIDPDTWQAYERKEGPSMWGHDRAWLPAEQQEAARKLRLDNAAKGLRRPVQVMEGNFNRDVGCLSLVGRHEGRPAVRLSGASRLNRRRRTSSPPSADFARSATVMRDSASENFSSARSSAGTTTFASSVEPASGASS